MKKFSVILLLVIILANSFMLSSCILPGSSMFVLTPQDLEAIQARTRTFETSQVKQVRAACIDALQDMGFALDATSSAFGIIVASKVAKHVSYNPLALSLTYKLTTGDKYAPVVVSKKMRSLQRIMVSIQRLDSSHVRVRATLQQTDEEITHFLDGHKDFQVSYRTISDPDTYTRFFAGVSRSLFLEEYDVF